MSSYAKVLLHIVFSTSKREPVLVEPLRQRLFGLMHEVVANTGGVLMNAGGVEDHVHLLVRMPATMALSEFMRKLKSVSSKWINEERLSKGVFAWQKGYGAFSIGESQVEIVRRYIANQVEHHQRKSFAEELEEFLRAYDLPYNPEFLVE